MVTLKQWAHQSPFLVTWQVADLEVGLAAAVAAKEEAASLTTQLQDRLQQLTEASSAREGELSGQLSATTTQLEAATTAAEASKRELASINMRLEIATQEAASNVGRGQEDTTFDYSCLPARLLLCPPHASLPACSLICQSSPPGHEVQPHSPLTSSLTSCTG